MVFALSSRRKSSCSGVILLTEPITCGRSQAIIDTSVPTWGLYPSFGPMILLSLSVDLPPVRFPAIAGGDKREKPATPPAKVAADFRKLRRPAREVSFFIAGYLCLAESYEKKFTFDNPAAAVRSSDQPS